MQKYFVKVRGKEIEDPALTLGTRTSLLVGKKAVSIGLWRSKCCCKLEKRRAGKKLRNNLD